MWLGMLAAAVGQVPGLPVEPLTWVAGLLAAYIAQVAQWFAAPRWARLDLGLAGVPALIGTYAALGARLCLVISWTRRRGRLGPGRRALAWPALAGLGGARRVRCRSAPRRLAAPGRRRWA